MACDAPSASIQELAAATSWQTHSVRGALAGTLKKKGHVIFTLDQVRALLRLADNEARSCGEVDAIAAAQLSQIEDKIADLEALRVELSGLLEHCKRGTIEECRILNALGPPGQ